MKRLIHNFIFWEMCYKMNRIGKCPKKLWLRTAAEKKGTVVMENIPLQQ